MVKKKIKKKKEVENVLAPMSTFVESPEYLRGAADFRIGLRAVDNPFATREAPSIAPWLWNCGWTDALKISVDYWEDEIEALKNDLDHVTDTFTEDISL